MEKEFQNVSIDGKNVSEPVILYWTTRLDLRVKERTPSGISRNARRQERDLGTQGKSWEVVKAGFIH